MLSRIEFKLEEYLTYLDEACPRPPTFFSPPGALQAVRTPIYGWKDAEVPKRKSWNPEAHPNYLGSLPPQLSDAFLESWTHRLKTPAWVLGFWQRSTRRSQRAMACSPEASPPEYSTGHSLTWNLTWALVPTLGLGGLGSICPRNESFAGFHWLE